MRRPELRSKRPAPWTNPTWTAASGILARLGLGFQLSALALDGTSHNRSDSASAVQVGLVQGAGRLIVVSRRHRTLAAITRFNFSDAMTQCVI